jgi:hypothetical protein
MPYASYIDGQVEHCRDNPGTAQMDVVAYRGGGMTDRKANRLCNLESEMSISKGHILP